MEYAGLAILIVAPVAAAIAAYVTELSRFVLLAPLLSVALGYWIAYGWLNVASLDLTRWVAAFVTGLYALAWLMLCHLLVAAGRALRTSRRG